MGDKRDFVSAVPAPPHLRERDAVLHAVNVLLPRWQERLDKVRNLIIGQSELIIVCFRLWASLHLSVATSMCCSESAPRLWAASMPCYRFRPRLALRPDTLHCWKSSSERFVRALMQSDCSVQIERACIDPDVRKDISSNIKEIQVENIAALRGFIHEIRPADFTTIRNKGNPMENFSDPGPGVLWLL